MPPPPSTPKSKHKRQTSNPQTPSPEKQRLNGLLKDGLVYCNCEPRAEARLFETKKEGPNQGKWFYRCARSGKFKCNFFLWESEKLEREAGLTPAQKKEADKEAVVHGPSKTPKSCTPKMTQRKLASFGYTKRRRNSDEITTSSGSDSEGAAEAASKGKRKLDAFEEDSEKDSFGSFDSEDEQELAAMADETAEKAAATPAATKVVAGLPTPSTTRTLFPGAQEERVAKRQRTMGFDDLPDTPSKPPNDGPSSSPATIQAPSTATTKTVSFSSPPAPTPTADATTNNNKDPLDAMASILQNYTLSEPDAAALRNLLVVETRKRAGAEKSRDFKQKLCNEKDARIAKLQEEVAALRNKERVMHGQITEMRAKVMRHYQDFGNI